jgi:phospholipid/cholesterol/gamma-HCH transport system substrate-binding protein
VLAANEAPLKRTLEELPATLDVARTTLERTPPFAASLERTLTALDPTIKGSQRMLRETPAALRGVVPLPADELARFVDATAPLARHVRPAARDVATSTPPLRRAFGVLGRTADRMAYTPEDGRPYLFWLAWFTHNVNSMFASQDAHGAVVRGFVLTSCASLAQTGEVQHLLQQVLGPGSPTCEEDGP